MGSWQKSSASTECKTQINAGRWLEMNFAGTTNELCMKNFADTTFLVSGAFFAAAVETLKEFNHLGQSVLAEHNIDAIDKTQFYPNGLRIDFFNAIYERFGEAGLAWVGAESPRYFFSDDQIKSTPLWIRVQEMKFDAEIQSSADKLSQYFQKYMEIYCEELTNILIASTKNAEYPVGQFLIDHPSGRPLHYLIKINVKLPKIFSHWTRATAQTNSRIYLPEGWNFKLTINEELTRELDFYSEFYYDMAIFPMAPGENRATCTLNDRMEFREALLKAALNHSFKQEQALKVIHEKTMESIRYAAAVQKNQLPKVTPKHGFNDVAVRWEPKDTIGGDIWWLSAEDSAGPVTLALIDCTGHGVPGAMTATLVSNALTRLFAENPFCTLEDAMAGIGQSLAQSFGSFDNNSDVANGCDLVMIQKVPNSSQYRLGLAGINVMHYRRQSQMLDLVQSPRSGISAHPRKD